MTLKRTIVLALFMAFSATATAVRAESYRMQNKNVLTLSFFDSALLYSLNYDRNITDWFGLGGGASFIGSSQDYASIGQAYVHFYPVGNDTTSLLISGSANLALSNFNTLGVEGQSGYGTVGVGVEYRKNFVFRAKVHMIITDEEVFAPWPGISIGGAF